MAVVATLMQVMVTVGETEMDWTSLAYVLVILIMAISLLLMWAWPRHPDGTFMSVEEVEEFMDKFPRPPMGRAKGVVVMVFATLGMIAIALTSSRRGRHHHDDHDD